MFNNSKLTVFFTFICVFFLNICNAENNRNNNDVEMFSTNWLFQYKLNWNQSGETTNIYNSDTGTIMYSIYSYLTNFNEQKNIDIAEFITFYQAFKSYSKCSSYLVINKLFQFTDYSSYTFDFIKESKNGNVLIRVTYISREKKNIAWFVIYKKTGVVLHSMKKPTDIDGVISINNKDLMKLLVINYLRYHDLWINYIYKQRPEINSKLLNDLELNMSDIGLIDINDVRTDDLEEYIVNSIFNNLSREKKINIVDKAMIARIIMNLILQNAL
jgi:hypothetical protein